MAIAGTLEIQMLANMARLQSDMTSAKGMVGDAMKGIESAVASAKNVLGALGVGLGMREVLNYTKAIIDAADAMNDMSQRVGIAVRDLAKYELATAQSGTTMEALAKGIKGISVNLLENGDALKKAGLTATTADVAMLQLADLFKSMPDGIEKTALAVKLFGKSGMDLIPMLNMGSKGLDDAAEKSAKYAAIMAVMAPQADEFNDSLAELWMYSKIAGMGMMNDALPGLLAISKAMAEATQNGGMLKGIMAGLGAGFENYKTNVKNFWGIKPSDGGASGGWDGGATGSWGSSTDKNTASQDKIIADAAAFAKRLRAALGGDGGTGGKAAADPYIKLQEAAAKYTVTLQKEADQLGMTDVEKKLYDANVIALTLHKGKERDSFTASTTEMIKEVDAYKKAVESAKERADLRKKESDGIEAYMVAGKISLLDAAHNAEEAVKQAQLEYDTIGMLKSGVQALTLVRMQDKLTTESAGSEAYASLVRQIEAQKKLIGITQNIEVKNASDTFAQTLHDDVKNALSTAFRDTKDPIAAFGNAVGNVLFTRVTSALADSLATSFLKSSMGTALTSMFSFAGGGYTGDGSRSGGVDGMGGFMAVMHPQETVIDHTRGQSAGGGSNVTNININATVGDIATKSDVVAGMRATANQITSSLMRSNQYGGAVSR